MYTTLSLLYHNISADNAHSPILKRIILINLAFTLKSLFTMFQGSRGTKFCTPTTFLNVIITRCKVFRVNSTFIYNIDKIGLTCLNFNALSNIQFAEIVDFFL